MVHGTLIAVCASKERTEPKVDIGSGELRVNYGLVGDAHAGTGAFEVSLIAYESISRAREQYGIDARPGCFADNLTVQGLDVGAIRVGDRIHVGPAILEVVQIGKPPDAPHTYDFHGVSLLRQEGVFCRVIRGGHIRRGDAVMHIPMEREGAQEEQSQ
ncbi:MAG: MOSC domain-containing protein [Anaerolineae bacterium]|jgi:MOSC domain-containing protein YiiM|nr:MOSC domain-containing protein [Anaerolineae bacterium]